MQCFFDQLTGVPRAGLRSRRCDLLVARNMWTSELHGAVAHASQDQIIGKLECAAGQGGRGHRFQIRNYELRIRKNENGCSVRCPQRRNSNSFHSALRQRTLHPAAPLIGQLRSRFSALIEGQRCKSQDCFGERKQTRETPAHRRASCALPYGFGGAAGFAASPGFGGAPPADAGPPGRSSSGTASISCSTNDSG